MCIYGPGGGSHGSVGTAVRTTGGRGGVVLGGGGG